MLTGFEMFDITGSVLPVFFIAIAGILIISVSFSLGRWLHNNRQPVLNVSTIVRGKRTEVKTKHESSDTDSFRQTTHYFVTFELESGDRLEFEVHGDEYGKTAEGDRGILTFQGTRYLGFRRELKSYAHSY